jgi:hypothetical protein
MAKFMVGDRIIVRAPGLYYGWRGVVIQRAWSFTKYTVWTLELGGGLPFQISVREEALELDVLLMLAKI